MKTNSASSTTPPNATRVNYSIRCRDRQRLPSVNEVHWLLHGFRKARAILFAVLGDTPSDQDKARRTWIPWLSPRAGKGLCLLGRNVRSGFGGLIGRGDGPGHLCFARR